MRWFALAAFIIVVLYIVFMFYQSYRFNKSEASNQLIKIGQGIAVIVLVVFLIRYNYSKYEQGPYPADFTWNDALLMCQTTITKFARDPDTAVVPYVPNVRKGNEYYFAWGDGTKYVRIRNDLGLEVPVSAYCIVDGNTRTITQLSIDGKTIK